MPKDGASSNGSSHGAVCRRHSPSRTANLPTARLPSRSSRRRSWAGSADFGRFECALPRLSEMGFDRFLVPFEADPWQVGYVQEPVLDVVGPLEDRIRPVLPFE